MLRTNLSTRPFYNERGVHGVLALTAAIVLLFTVFSVFEIVVLTRRQSGLAREAEAAETRAADLRARAVRTRQAINTKQMEAIGNAAREANAVIGQRLFSWTALLNHLATTLPDNVRIASLRPRVEPDGSIVVQMTLIGRTVEEIGDFITRLEQSASFRDVLPGEEVRTEDGLVQSTVEGKYAAAH
jgi:Tfp pilus assembly protein PilN